MLSFVGVLFFLFIISLCYDETPSFGRNKMAPVRAVMALLIVADHLTFHVGLPWIQPMRKWGAPIVSMFFFMSGYGLVKSYLSKGRDYLNGFFRKRIWKVILPSLIAYCLYLLVCWRSHDFLGEVRSLLVDGVPMLPYSWFVEVMVLLYAGFWLSFRFAPEKMKLPLVLVWSGLLIVLPAVAGYDRCWWVGTLAFPAGMIFAKYEKFVYSGLLRSRLTYVLSFVSFIFVTSLLYETGNEYLYTLCYVSIPFAVAVVLSRLPLRKVNCTIVAFLAGISYEIYLCQGIAMEFLHGMFVNIQNEYVYIVAVYAMAIVLAFVTERLSSSLYKLKCR